MKMKELSFSGLISHSLLDYIDFSFYTENELIGFLAVYVDDTLIMGNSEFYKT